MPKKPYTWGKVKAGDIISFRYKSKKDNVATLDTLLVLNTNLPFKKKDGTTNFHLVGLKLESQGTIPLVKNKPALVRIIEKIGDVKIVEGTYDIFRVVPFNVGPRGVSKKLYARIKEVIEKYSMYRTYDFIEAKKSAVFLEPVELPNNVMELLRET